MIDLIPPQYRLLAVIGLAAALFLGGAAGGYTWRDMSAKADIAELKADQAELITKAARAERDGVAAVLQIERSLRSQAEEAANALRARTDLGRNAAGLDAELQRLREQARSRPPAWSCTGGATAGPAAGASASAASGVVPPVSDRVGLLQESATGFAAMAQHSMACDARHRTLTDYYNQARERLRRMGEAGRTIDP